MTTRSLPTSTAALAALALAACSSPDSGSEAAPAESASSPAATETTDDGPNSPQTEADSPAGDSSALVGVTFHEYPAAWLDGSTGNANEDMGLRPGEGQVGGWASAPNGEQWPVYGEFHLDELLAGTESATATAPPEIAGARCEGSWESSSAVWLRDRPSEDNPDGADLNVYHQGPTDGPMCFTEPGGGVAEPEYRLVHYVCHSAGTTARFLVSDAGGGPAVWTPEHTAENDRPCFHFGGDEVRAHQVELSATP